MKKKRASCRPLCLKSRAGRGKAGRVTRGRDEEQPEELQRQRCESRSGIDCPRPRVTLSGQTRQQSQPSRSRPALHSSHLPGRTNDRAISMMSSREAVRSSQQNLLFRSVQLAGNRTKPASLHRLNVRPMACAAFASTPQAHEIGTYQAELKDRHCHAMNALALVVDNAHNGVAEACIQIVRPVCTGRRAQ
jgi:hypothetical protein